MGHVLHYVLIVAAIFLNRKDRKMLALSLVIGLSILAPVGHFTNKAEFCTICIASDFLLGVLAIYLDTSASAVVLIMSGALCAWHLAGWWYGGWLPDSPYHLLSQACEYIEISACCAFSARFAKPKPEPIDLLQSGRGYRKDE